MDELHVNRTFLQVVASGSFSAAAAELGISVASVARQVNALEASLNVQLLHRTTRSMSLTEAGAIYYDKMRHLLSAIDAVRREVTSYQRDVKGVLRVHLRHSVGHQLIVPALPAFMRDHPEITLDVIMTDQREDLIAKGVDVAVWLGSLNDSSLMARRLVQGNRQICCSPDYVAAHGLPLVPADLHNHNCLVYKSGDRDAAWHFVKDGQAQTVAVSGSLESESSIVLLTCALKGLGIVALQEAMIRAALDSGQLVKLLPDHEVRSTELDFAYYAVYPGSKHTSPKTRAFVDFLVRLFRPY